MILVRECVSSVPVERLASNANVSPSLSSFLPLFSPLSESCPSNNWGIGCSSSCSCGEGGDCDGRNGECICNAGWNGDKCDQSKKREEKGL